jgi:hypothetical protein
MNRRQHRPHQLSGTRLASDGRALRGFGLFALLGVSCLPSDNLSDYSKGGLLITQDEDLPSASDETPIEGSASGLGEGAPGDGAAADGVLTGSAPPLSTGTVDGTTMEGSSPATLSDVDAGPIPTEQPGGDAAAAATDAGSVSGCASGATVGPGQRCFALLTTPSSWQDARTACQAKGTGWDLTTIHSAARNSFLASFLGTLSDAWVGASDAQSEGVWRWLGDSGAFWNGNGTTGSAAGNAFVSWTAGANPEPNGGDLSDCLRLRAGGGWADLQCTTLFAAICEGPSR